MSCKDRIRSSLFLGLLAVFASSQSFASYILEFDPSSTSLSVGNSFTVDINISGLHDPDPDEIVSTYDLFIGYDPSVLSWVSVSFGAALGGGPLQFAYNEPVAGQVEIRETSLLPDSVLDALQGDSITLAALSFDALAEGLVGLSFIDHPFFGYEDIKGRNASVLPVSTINADITVGPAMNVPEPGTLMLLLSGLLGFLRLPTRIRLLRTN